MKATCRKRETFVVVGFVPAPAGRKSPLTVPVKKPKATWVKREVLTDVEYRSITEDGRMRHGSFKGLREDLLAPRVRNS
jgi:ATP-dependent DNA ligase